MWLFQVELSICYWTSSAPHTPMKVSTSWIDQVALQSVHFFTLSTTLDFNAAIVNKNLLMAARKCLRILQCPHMIWIVYVKGVLVLHKVN